MCRLRRFISAPHATRRKGLTLHTAPRNHRQHPNSELEKIFTVIKQMEADGVILIRHGLTDKWAAFQTNYLES
jgi:hypothetical protein